MDDPVKHYHDLADRWMIEADRYKAMLYDAWRTMAGQTRGLQRQARRIKQLRKQVETLKAALAMAVNNEKKL